MAISDSAIRKLKPTQRDMLIDHIDGSVEISLSYLTQTRNSLLDLKLLRGHPAGAVRPRQTILTEAGRHAVGIILGDHADALVRAGLLEQENPLEVLRQLKALRSDALQPARPSDLAVQMAAARDHQD